MKAIRLIFLLLLLPVVCLAETYSLPIDTSSGMPYHPDCLTDAVTYEDPTISVKITQGREFDTDWWMADITIADPSQLRTMAAGKFSTTRRATAKTIARRANAIIAIDGDFFSIESGKKGCYVLRQGVLYNESLIGKSDVLLIDEDGDFHAVYMPQAGEVSTEIDGKAVINGFCFGPVLVADGVARELPSNEFMATDLPRARTALCQIGPLHYAAIVCAGPMSGNVGLTVNEFAQVCANRGVDIAYNLDGGNSTMMYFCNKMVNTNRSTREISDIVYFASAYPEEAT